jgi:nucleoside-diphosphate-sugar epimerase
VRATLRVLILGCGYAGSAIARLARREGHEVLANVRSDARAKALRAEGFEVLQLPSLDSSIGAHVDERTHVVVAFPPDGATDARVAPALAGAAALTYLSSTGVYGEQRGVVDDTTPVPSPAEGGDERGARLLEAERLHRQSGATVLRCPALYGRDRGLHVRVLQGKHSIPGDGSRALSRIHVDDLAQLVLASARCAPPAAGETFVVGDHDPARHDAVVRFIAEAYGVPMPPFVPLESVHASLRADRRVDASRALARFGVRLEYPSYRDGMAPSATGLAASVSGPFARRC